ncbi:MAG: DUF2075 domain-containing protein [Lactobacillaceae bacterium]|nr:DUF2075 domain-containing protein [Lactobacillaceae bacterium]
MATNKKPTIKSIVYSQAGLRNLPKDLSTDEQQVLLKMPTVYLVNQQSRKKYQVYVGEANDIVQRTKQHLNNADDKLQQLDSADMYIIGDELFHKSMTLDIENRFIEYFLGVPQVSEIELLNGRTNEQGNYSGKDDATTVFEQAIAELHQRDRDLFPKLSEIVSSAIFKASPFKTLNTAQQNVKADILKLVRTQQAQVATGQLLLVKGAAGTGKTVLLSNLFYELATREFAKSIDGRETALRVALVVNHDEQVKVYEQLVAKLKLVFGAPEFIVGTPSQLINHVMKTDTQFDVVLIDEAHLVWTQGHMAAWTKHHQARFATNNQICAIRQIAKSTIAIFDPQQIIRVDQSWSDDDLLELEQGADEVYTLDGQMRMQASEATQAWIQNFVDGELGAIPVDPGYDLQIFADAQALFTAIKAKNADVGLSRMITTYDWDWKPKGEWNVTAGNLVIPWNMTTVKLPKQQSWAEYDATINEIGSTYTIQGFDLNYAGLILGPSVQYRNGHIVIDETMNKSPHALKTRNDGRGAAGQAHLRDALNVLLKRGVKGLYIYAVDDALRERLLELARE